MNIFAITEDENDHRSSEQLLNAASFGRLDSLRDAIKKGGDANYVRLDVSPTLIATKRDFTEALQILMDNGARADIANKYGWTALHEAVSKEESELLEIILSAPSEQVDLFARDTDGRTALFAAMDFDRMNNAELLLKKERELIDRSDKKGITPTLYAIHNKKGDWLEFLLKNGADLNRTSENFQTTLEAAGEWEEGRYIIENTRSVVVEKVEKVFQEPVAVEVVVEEQKPSNPFGLGGVKKKTLG